MDERTIVQASKKLSWLLRHGAAEAGVALDSEGWADIAKVLSALRMPRAHFDAAVSQNNKKRFEVDGDRVRACQGHSAGVVSQDAVESSWVELAQADGTIWHGTNLEVIDQIAKEGLLPVSRTHVHLAEHTNSTVGKRANVDVLLGVSIAAMRAAGEPLWKSPNGVILARRVPPSAIVTVRAAHKRAESAVDRVRALFASAKE
ncbi:MAG: RNA 2'-phosphotransferase [Myxococcales bacterium]|nr:RNA 2'-phosphotransferase [Myxococcales bacterium]